MGVTTHQPGSRISAAFSFQLVNTQLLALVYTYRHSYGRYRVLALQLPTPKSDCQHNCCLLYSKCTCSDCLPT